MTRVGIASFGKGAWVQSGAEASSPGLERGLYEPGDYERFAGKMAKMRTRGAVNGQRNFRGRLAGVEGGDVLFDDKTSGRIRVPFSEIAKANLEIDVEEEFRLAEERERAAKGGGARTTTE
jgi:ribosome maturation factor RimP